MMGIVGFTHTQAPLTPPTAPYSTNENWVLFDPSAGSGAAPSPSTSAHLPRSPTTRRTRRLLRLVRPHLDLGQHRRSLRRRDDDRQSLTSSTASPRTTIRRPGRLEHHAGVDFPLRRFDHRRSPATHTLIDGTFAAHVGGVGVYTFINDMLYLEATAYKTLTSGSRTRWVPTRSVHPACSTAPRPIGAPPSSRTGAATTSWSARSE